MTGTSQVIRGNALTLPLADASVVTSPPYFGLRSYQDNGEHYQGQIGAEPTPAEFVDALIAATREMVRVLKPSGSIWVNLGDKYCADNRGSGGDAKRGEAKWAPAGKAGFPGEGIVKQKSLMGIPWRYAIRCIDDLGLILRAEVIWSKPNGLPESVTDRVRRSHETWFHFTKEPKYFSAVDEIREGYAPATAARYAAGYNPRAVDAQRPSVNTKLGGDTYGENPLGKLPGSVWSIPTQPLQVPAWLGVDHFAAYPMEFPRRIIQGWSPAGVCTACREGRRPVSRKEAHGEKLKRNLRHIPGYADPAGEGQRDVRFTITGYACACPPFGGPAPTTPAVVLDPFGGTGTTALVAKSLGRTGLSVDMSADYCRLAEWRTNDRGQLAAALQVEKAEPVHVDQLALFEETA